MEAINTAWDFFQNEILGMRWLNRLIGTVLKACGLDTAGRIGGSIQFFIYDTIKIMVLLGILFLIIAYIQSYFPPERTKKYLAGFTGSGQIYLPPYSERSHRFVPARRFRCLLASQAQGYRRE